MRANGGVTRRVTLVKGRLLVGLGAASAALLSAGVASAYWTSQGSGAATASAGSLQPVTVAAYANESISNKLYPGGPAGDVVLKVTNPNLYSVTLVAIAANGSIAADAGHSGCTTTGVAFAPPASPSITIGAGTAGSPSTQLVTLAGAALMGTSSASGCQGATFQIPVSITVHK